MSQDAASIRRSLIDRAAVLGAYVASLQGRAPTDDAYSVALEMCQRYTRLLGDQMRHDWKRTDSAHRRDDIFRGHRMAFDEREAFIDRWFARGHGHVPRALQTIARRHFASHGLNDHEPVLSVGPPDAFEMRENDLADYLFAGFDALRPEDYVGIPRDTKLALVNVPNIGGTGAVWHPIIIGHEVAHLRIKRDVAAIEHLDTGDWVDEFDADLAELMDAGGANHERVEPGYGGIPVVAKLRTTLQSWVDELLCDLNAVRLFGPAGLAAVGEYIRFYTTPARTPPEVPTPTHPRLRLRIDVMLRYLTRLGETSLPEHVDRWVRYNVDEPEQASSHLHAYIEGLILDEEHLDRIMIRALQWGETYRHRHRQSQIQWLSRELLDGIPGGTHAPDSGGDGEVMIADVVNAAWHARSVLEANAYEADQRQKDVAASSDEPPESPVLLNNDALSHDDKRLQLDALATKAIDSLEFALLWRLTGETVPTFRPIEGSAERDDRLTGVLSQGSISARLSLREGKQRLVVTPLLGDAVQDAGIDLRLAPEFIAFRHSATTAFDALARQDPRSVQERVEKAWGDPFILHPGELVLAATLEYIVVPHDVAAQVVTRSSYGRLGLITATAVQVQPGSRGCITLELVNHGETPIALTPGSRVAQLVFFSVAGAATPKQNKYWFPVGPEFSKVTSDKDIFALGKVGAAAVAGMLHRERRSALDPGRPVLFRLVGGQTDVTRCATIAESESVRPTVEILSVGEHGWHDGIPWTTDGIFNTHAVVALSPMRSLARVLTRLTLASGALVSVEFLEETDGVTPSGLDIGDRRMVAKIGLVRSRGGGDPSQLQREEGPRGAVIVRPSDLGEETVEVNSPVPDADAVLLALNEAYARVWRREIEDE